METNAQPTVQERVSKIETVMETERPHLATKADIGEVKLEIAEVKIEMAEVKIEVAELKVAMIRWYIVTSISIIAVLLAAMQYFFG